MKHFLQREFYHNVCLNFLLKEWFPSEISLGLNIGRFKLSFVTDLFLENKIWKGIVFLDSNRIEFH